MNLEGEASGQTGNAATSSDGAAQTGSAAPVVSDWTSGLSEDNRKTVEAKGWVGRGPDEVVKSYRNLESQLGKAIVVPKDDAAPEEWSKFFGKIGRPEEPGAYDLKRPQGIPENLPYDAKAADWFKVLAHKAGLTPKQAQMVHDDYMGRWANDYQSVSQQQEQKVKESHEAIVKEWGDPDSTKYKRNQELANRTIRNNGGDDLLKELQSFGAMGPNKEVLAPRLASLLAKLGESNYAEDGLWAGESTRINPFAKATENLTEQGKIIRSDPDHARVLIRQAGIDPKDYKL